MGGQESLLKELVGLFLGFGAESSVALLATLPPPHYCQEVLVQQAPRGEREKRKREKGILLDLNEGAGAEISL